MPRVRVPARPSSHNCIVLRILKTSEIRLTLFCLFVYFSWRRSSEHHEDGCHEADCGEPAVGGGPAPLSDRQGGGRLHLPQGFQGMFVTGPLLVALPLFLF